MPIRPQLAFAILVMVDMIAVIGSALVVMIPSPMVPAIAVVLLAHGKFRLSLSQILLLLLIVLVTLILLMVLITSMSPLTSLQRLTGMLHLRTKLPLPLGL